MGLITQGLMVEYNYYKRSFHLIEFQYS